jgi:hypothetical protein
MQHKLYEYFPLFVHVKPRDSFIQTVNAAILQNCSYLVTCILLSVQPGRVH